MLLETIPNHIVLCRVCRTDRGISRLFVAEGLRRLRTPWASQMLFAANTVMLLKLEWNSEAQCSASGSIGRNWPENNSIKETI